jgi:hypothetical protein
MLSLFGRLSELLPVVVLRVDGSCQVQTTLSSQAPDFACTAAAARQHAVNSAQGTSGKGSKAATVLQQLANPSQVISTTICNRSTSMQQLLLSGQSIHFLLHAIKAKLMTGVCNTDLPPESVYTHAEPMVQSQVSSGTVALCQAVLFVCAVNQCTFDTSLRLQL